MNALRSVFAPLVTAYDPVALKHAGAASRAPSLAHPVGTDQYGRDTFTRIVYGGRGLALRSLSRRWRSRRCSAARAGSLKRVLPGLVRRAFDARDRRALVVSRHSPGDCAARLFRGRYPQPRVSDWPSSTPGRLCGWRGRRFSRFVRSSTSKRGAPWAANDLARLCVFAPCCRTPPRRLIVETTLRLAYAILAEASLSFLGPRSPTARTELGADDRRRAQLFGAESVGDGGPWSRHYGDGIGV